MIRLWKDGGFSSEFCLDVSRGVTPFLGERKFGRIDDLSTIDGERTVWDYPSDYTITTDLKELFISSANISDTHEVVIFGLSETYHLKSLTISLQGQASVAIGSWTHIYRFYNNSNTASLGNQYIYEANTVVGGVPQDPTKVKAFLQPKNEGTMMCFYMVPAGYRGYMVGFKCEVVNKIAASVDGSIKVKPFGKIARTRESFGTNSAGGGSSSDLAISSSIILNPKDFIYFRCSTDANNISIGVTFGLVLEPIGE